jgi:Helix-turn-helix of DDE superfamily endonuclease
MLRVNQLQKRPAAFQRLTGVTIDEFNTITELTKPLWNESELKRLNRNKRTRAIGAGAKFKLNLETQILMTLIYLKQYCTLEFLGWLIFNLDKSNVCRNIHLVLPLLEIALPSPIRAKTLQTQADDMPRAGWSTSKRRKIGTLKEFLEVFLTLNMHLAGRVASQNSRRSSWMQPSKNEHNRKLPRKKPMARNQQDDPKSKRSILVGNRGCTR